MHKPALLILLLLPALAEAQTLTRREKGDLAIQARAILSNHCGECHGDANNASRLAVLDYTKVVSKSVPVSFVALDGKRSQALELIESGTMPPGNRTGPSEAEIDVLKKWVAEKAPDYPRAFDDRTTLATMLKDYEGLDEELKPHVRYLSLGHLVPADGAPEGLGKAEQRLRQSLLAATGKPVAPVPVDSTATLFRLDLQKLGWDVPDLFEKIRFKGINGLADLVAYDLILLEYPDAVPVPSEMAAKYAAFQKATMQLRTVPFLKADWLSEALAGTKQIPKATHLGEDLKSLVALAEAKAKKTKLPDGPAFSEEKVRFAGPDVASAAPPVGAMYSGNVSPKPPPFELTAEAMGPKDSIEAVFTREPFKLKVAANRDGNFHVLQVWVDGTVDYVEVNGGSILTADKARLLTPKGDAKFLIESIITGLGDGYEHFVVLATEKEAEPPIIARSIHPERPIWRFLPDEKHPTVRRVITLHVTKQ